MFSCPSSARLSPVAEYITSPLITTALPGPRAVKSWPEYIQGFMREQSRTVAKIGP
jgi:hypothetical protein